MRHVFDVMWLLKGDIKKSQTLKMFHITLRARACHPGDVLNVNLAHSFAKHHDVNSTYLISRRSIWHESNPHAWPETPSVGS